MNLREAGKHLERRLLLLGHSKEKAKKMVEEFLSDHDENNTFFQERWINWKAELLTQKIALKNWTL